MFCGWPLGPHDCDEDRACCRDGSGSEEKMLDPILTFMLGQCWEQSAVDQMKGSWKDEVSLVVLLLPAVLVFTPWQEHIHQGFVALQDLPSYYHNLLYIAISASFGIKGAQGAVKLFKK